MAQPLLTRRRVVRWLGMASLLPLMTACGEAASARDYPVSFTEAEWRRRLTPAQFAILRQKATEPPFTSPLLNEHRKGIFACVADGNPLFDSATKFDSGTGWPSFWRALPGAIGTSTDRDIGVLRTEVHCARCGGHLGHVFDDGPPPTGKRYCMNGTALRFEPSITVAY